MQEVSGSSPLSSTQFKSMFSNAEPMSVPLLRGILRGKIRRKLADSTSDHAKVVSPPGPNSAFATFKRSPVLARGDPRGPNSLRAAEPSSVAWCRLGEWWWSLGAWTAVK